jgi:uncharacterized RDD family membrane protein YckC
MNKKRIVAGLIDFIILCIIQAVLMFAFLLKPMIENVGNDITFNIMIRQLIITLCALSFMIFRDIIGEKSIGKRIVKLKIIDKKNGNVANFKKRILRNITWVLGWVEIIYFLIKDKRIGDIIADTDVVET